MENNNIYKWYSKTELDQKIIIIHGLPKGFSGHDPKKNN